ncbi:MAG: class I mannose-6-phosphate isomerase [Bacteroidota bacterium]
MSRPNYNRYPSTELNSIPIWSGWSTIAAQILSDRKIREKTRKLIVIECYTGILYDDLLTGISFLKPDLLLDSREAFKPGSEILNLTHPDVTDDRIFGRMTKLGLENFLDQGKISDFKCRISDPGSGTVVVFGPGASIIAGRGDLLVYADMARWEIQIRMRSQRVQGLGVDDHVLEFSYQYKRGLFVDWRVCDKVKKELFGSMDYILDTNQEGEPKMLTGRDYLAGLQTVSIRPFRIVPYFDPAPWGGKWMKSVCGLDPEPDNYGWCFDCVPEENSLLFSVNGNLFETPSINLVFFESLNLLGRSVMERFGQEFPIRFDFLDTMGGGNLSLQVHPSTDYIREQFGMYYTQDESYYLLDAGDDATVYLGIRDGADPDQMIGALESANIGEEPFDAAQFVNIWPARKHDHFLIPAGTVHCSGRNAMVLEISATPYIFTFKLWDWARLGLDGQPRPINIQHGSKVINWDWRTEATRRELVNRIQPVLAGNGWREEYTGLHETEFIETRRHWFTKPVLHDTRGTVNVLNLVEGREAIVTSPTGKFGPFVVHYAETFIVPAAVGEYIIAPYGESEGKEIGTIKAYVR